MTESAALTGRLARDGGTVRDRLGWEGILHHKGRTLWVTLPSGKVAYRGTVTTENGGIACDLLCVVTGMGWRLVGTKDGDGWAIEGHALAVPAAYRAPGVDE